MELVILSLYGIALIVIFAYSLVQINLVKNYVRFHRQHDNDEQTSNHILEEDYPFVTVQLPVYNESYVVERLLDTVVKLNYPADKLEIQVLDDSTDDTVDLVAKKVAYYQKEGINIQHVKRVNRQGYKAGALADSMGDAKGEFIAIFDSDFLPDPDFLKMTVPYFNVENIGVVQTRWGHINRDYSMLTRMQAFGLDAHFSIEQLGRNAGEHFINFNGTAGIWRRSCIDDAGGWEHDTLTEDLDLSYRAQMKGWKFIFLEDVVSPAELPVTMSAVKSQQFRWMKGGAENLRKNSGRLLQSDTPWKTKMHGIFHLFNSSIFPCIFLVAILSIPILFIKKFRPEYSLLFAFGSFFIVSFVFLMIYYWNSYKSEFGSSLKSWFRFIWTFFQFLSFSMGLSFHNTIAVFEGYVGKKSSFVRTPKFNVFNKNDKWDNNKYIKNNLNGITIMEGLLSFYFLMGIVSAFYLGDFGMLPFHLLLFLGFSNVFVKSIRE